MIDGVDLKNKLLKIVIPVMLIMILIGITRSCSESKNRAIGEAEYNLALNTALEEYYNIENIPNIKDVKGSFPKRGANWHANINFNLDAYNENYLANYLKEQGWVLVQDKYYTHPSNGESRHRQVYCKNGVALYMDNIYINGQPNKPDGVSMDFQPYFCE